MSVDDPFGQRGPTAPAAPAPQRDEADAPDPDDDFDDTDDDTDDETDDESDNDDNVHVDNVHVDNEDVDNVDDADDANRAPGARAAAVAEFVATSFADHPDAIEIETRERGRDVSISIHADRGDVGRLIGRRGRVINAIRQVARAAGSIDGERVQLDIAED